MVFYIMLPVTCSWRFALCRFGSPHDRQIALISPLRPSNTGPISSARDDLAGEEIHALEIKVLGQFGFGRGARIAIEPLHDFAVREAHAARDGVKLRLRQSTGDSSRPQIDIAAGRRGQLLANDDIGKVQTPAGAQHSVDLAARAKLVGR